jgi:type IX secretion system PorP/SprF family membrane protein
MKLYPKFTVLLFSLTVQYCSHCWSQTMRNTLFDATPLQLNPAYAGNFDGTLRVAGQYRANHGVVTIPYDSYNLSVDAPVFLPGRKSYIGLGGHVSRDNAMEGESQNFIGEVSVAYHRIFGNDSQLSANKYCELAAGIQAGYAQASVDLAQIYFQNYFEVNRFGYFHQFQWGFPDYTRYGHVNAGISFEQSLSKHVQYLLGLSVHNINRPSDRFEMNRANFAGFRTRCTGTAGATIALGKHLVLRPAFIVLADNIERNIVWGNEFQYAVLSGKHTWSLFGGLWRRTGNIMMLSTGVNIRNFRVGMAVDLDRFGSAHELDNGYEIGITYFNRGNHKRRLSPACTRF